MIGYESVGAKGEAASKAARKGLGSPEGRGRGGLSVLWSLRPQNRAAAATCGLAISFAAVEAKNLAISAAECQGPLNGGVSNGGGFPIWTCPSFFVLFCPFWDFPDFSGIFPISSGMVRGFSRFVLFLFLGLLRAPTRNSPERVRDTIWTFPEKSGKHPGLETPRFSFSQEWLRARLRPPWSL